MMNGIVIKNTGSWYQVMAEDGHLINSKIKGNFRLKGIRTTNPVAVGDRVTLTVNADGNAFISQIEQRKNYIIRRASNLSKESHILAANIDQALLIVSLVAPVTNTTFIDRFLVTAEAYRIPVVIVINKSDLHSDEDKEYANAVQYLYESIGYKVLQVSMVEEIGLDDIKELIKNKISLFSGNSGVGKSTIINKILPELKLKVGDVSESHHTGMHTTTFSEMFPLPEGGFIIDTPGIKGFGTIDMEENEVAHYFPEIFKISADCKYNNCSHRHEPGCAVLRALDENLISKSRYSSYLSILEDSTDGKYRAAF